MLSCWLVIIPAKPGKKILLIPKSCMQILAIALLYISANSFARFWTSLKDKRAVNIINTVSIFTALNLKQIACANILMRGSQHVSLY